jgi:hypothetical protein
MAPRRLAAIVDSLTARETKLLLAVCLNREGATFGGLKALAKYLDSCTPKTASVTLRGLAATGLVEHDLRQGQRSPFTVRATTKAEAQPITSEVDTSEVAARDFGTDANPGALCTEEQSSIASCPTSEARVRARAKSQVSTSGEYSGGLRNQGNGAEEESLNLGPDLAVLDAVNRGRKQRGASPFERLPSFHDPIVDADQRVTRSAADGVGDGVAARVKGNR